MKNGLSKQEKESLDNKIVFASSATFLYAMLLAFVQRMSSEAVTVSGALAFIQILRWVSLAGAMACAAWSAYKEKKGFFVYCAVCLFIFLSTTVLLYCTHHGSNSAYLINYAALAVIFVLCQVYYALVVKGLIHRKMFRNIFVAVCVVAFVAFAVVSILNVNRIILPLPEKIF